MQAPPSCQSYRGVQRNPKPGTTAFMQGKKQAALSIQRYHILCAALQKKYEVRGIASTPDYQDPNFSEKTTVRATIDFGAYKEFKLRPLENIELPVQSEGAGLNLLALCLFPNTVSHDWRMREGGVLYTLGEYGDFFNSMLAYHGRGRTTEIAEWDTLFEKLQNGAYRKNIIPCMFFGQKVGCLDRNCPFLHDRDAVLADRAQILDDRRKRLSGYKRVPTWRQQVRRYHSVLDCMAGPDEALRAALDDSKVVDEGMVGDRAYCANPRCMKPWKKGEIRNPLKACKGCKITMYCSPECQKMDWPRHKQDPCAPIDDLAENDDLWNPIGTRKGTSFPFKTTKDINTNTLRWDA